MGKEHPKMRYQHDCDKCEPLGQAGKYDLYYCDKGNWMPTLIARWSGNGPDYKSGMTFVGHDLEITAAFELAKAKHLIE